MRDNAREKSCDVCNKSLQSERELQEHRETAHAQDKREKRKGSDQSQERPERHEPKREEHVA